MKRICLFVALVLLASLAAGCNPEGGMTEITVVTPFGSDDGNHVNYVQAYKAYEAATGHRVVDNSGLSNEEWKKQIISDFEKGEEADVLFFFTGADADSLVKNNKVVPISEIRRESASYASNMKDSMMPVSAADGRQYAVPVNGYWEGLYVNLKALEQCGISIPEGGYTWERFLEDCKILKEAGLVPIACSLNEIPHYWFEYCVFNNGSLYTHAATPENAEDTAGQAWVAGLEDIRLLYDSGFFPGNTNTITDSEANQLMLEDKAAFMLDGSWKLGWFQANADNIDNFAVTFVPAKGERKPSDIVGGLSMGYYITKKAWDDPGKRKASIDFVAAMTTDEVVSAFGASSVTALKNGANPPVNADALAVSALQMTKACTGIVQAAQDGLTPAARDSLFGNVKNIVGGKITPAEAINECLTAY